MSTHQASSSLGLVLDWLWAGERGAREERPGLVTEAGGPDTEWMGRNVLGGGLTTGSHYHHVMRDYNRGFNCGKMMIMTAPFILHLMGF